MDKSLIKDLSCAHKKVSMVMCAKCLTKTMFVDSERNKVLCTKCGTQDKLSEYVKRQNAATHEYHAKYGNVRR